MSDEMPREIWAGTVSHWNDGEGMYHHMQMGVCTTRYIRADIYEELQAQFPQDEIVLLRAENERRREAIRAAPHTPECSIHWNRDVEAAPQILELLWNGSKSWCDCWKREALSDELSDV